MLADKGRLYSVLAGTSLFFLFLFLAYWNLENFTRTKRALKQDLSDQMDLAVADYQDSLIQGFFRVLDIDLSHSVSQDLSVQITTDEEGYIFRRGSQQIYERDGSNDPYDVSQELTQDTNYTFSYDSVGERKVLIWDSDDIKGSMSINSDTKSFQSVKVDIDSVTKRLEFTNILTDSSSSDLQTSTDINAIYKHRLKNAGLLLDYTVETSSPNEHDIALTMAIPFTYFRDSDRPYAVFRKSNSYVLRQILTSLLLSIILLTVVAASFFLILKNWRSQMRLTAVKDEFIANMTHELKTPISTVGVALEALSSFGVIDDTEKRKEYLDISQHELERLKILVDKVLKMSTLDQDLNIENFEKLDFRRLTTDMLHSMRLHFKKHDVRVDYHPAEGDYTMNGDKVHLVNVLYNIVDNSIKYAHTSPYIDITLSSTDSHISIIIKDDGPGIPKEYLPKIFDRLFRVPTNSKHNVKGHGLGLHYAKSVITKHNGTIEANSALGKGTSFTIKLPKDLD